MKISCSKHVVIVFIFNKKDTIIRLALSGNWSRAFCWRRSIPLVTLRKCFVLRPLCSNFSDICSKAAIDFIYIVVLSTEKQLKSSWVYGRESGVKVFWKKARFFWGGEGPFLWNEKVYIEIFYIYHTFKVPRKLISKTSRKTKMANCNFFSSTRQGGTSTFLHFSCSLIW